MWCCVYIVYEATVEKYKPMLWVSSAGSLTPTAVSSYMRTKTKHTTKNPTHIQTLQKVFRYHLSHHDRSAGRQWCWLSSRFLSISVSQFCFDQERHLAQVAILDYCFARKFLNILSACHYACQHNVSALSVRNVPSVWSCDHFSSVACFNLSPQHCRLWLCSSLPVFITDGARSVNN